MVATLAGTLGSSANCLTPANHARVQCAEIHDAGSTSAHCKNDDSSGATLIIPNTNGNRLAHNARKSEQARSNGEPGPETPLRSEFAHIVQLARAAAKRSGMKPSDITKAIANVRRANGT